MTTLSSIQSERILAVLEEALDKLKFLGAHDRSSSVLGGRGRYSKEGTRERASSTKSSNYDFERGTSRYENKYCSKDDIFQRSRVCDRGDFQAGMLVLLNSLSLLVLL